MKILEMPKMRVQEWMHKHLMAENSKSTLHGQNPARFLVEEMALAAITVEKLI